MDFVGGLPKSTKDHYYLYVVVDRFNKMCILIPCNKQVTAEKQQSCSFTMYGFILGYPFLLYLAEIPDLLGSFG